MRCMLTVMFAFVFAILSELLDLYISKLHRWPNRMGHTSVFLGILFVLFNADDGRDFEDYTLQKRLV